MTFDEPCLQPGCGEPSIGSLLLRCLDHLDEDLLLMSADTYAVASVLYYEHDVSAISDALYDGTCHTLLRGQAWKRVLWIEEDILRAGSGYDLSRVPTELRALADSLVGYAQGLERDHSSIQRRMWLGEFQRETGLG